jgi:hypothetical protein
VKFKFSGALSALKEQIGRLSLKGEWQEHPNDVWIFRCKDGVGVHWAKTTGALWFSGPKEGQRRAERRILPALRDYLVKRGTKKWDGGADTL